MIVDACILIAALSPTDTHHAVAVEILSGDDDFLIHPINLAEALVGPARLGRLPIARQLLSELRVEEALIPAGQAKLLAEARATTGLRLPDCCVLTLARATGNDTIATVDARLAATARKQGFLVKPD